MRAGREEIRSIVKKEDVKKESGEREKGNGLTE